MIPKTLGLTILGLILISVANASPKKIILIGLDGLPISVFKEALSKGSMPYLKSLQKDYKTFQIKSDYPPYSNLIWTNYFTGFPPERHGIKKFYKDLNNGNVKLYESGDVKVPMIWEILDRNNVPTFVSGFFAIHPVKKFKKSKIISQRAFYIDEITKHLQKVTTGPESLDTPLKMFWSRMSDNNNFQIRSKENATYPRSIQKALLSRCATKKNICMEKFKEYFPPILLEKVGEKTPYVVDYICSTCISDEIFLEELNKPNSNGFYAVHLIFPDVINHSLLDWWPYQEYINYFTKRKPFEDLFIFKALKRFDQYLKKNISPHLKENTTLIIISDHGVHSARFDISNSLTPEQKNGFALIYEKGNKAGGFSKKKFGDFDLFPFVLNKLGITENAVEKLPEHLQGKPVCLKLSENEKKSNFKAIIIMKDDLTFKEWLAKDYNPLTKLPAKPDKQGKALIQGNKLKIYFNSGIIKNGNVLKFHKNSILPKEFEVFLEKNIRRVFGEDYCLL